MIKNAFMIKMYWYARTVVEALAVIFGEIGN